MTAQATLKHPALNSLLAEEFSTWGVTSGGCALVGPDGVIGSAGDVDEVLPWASVTKVLAALAVLSVVEDGALSLDDPAGPRGATVRHLLAHASGLAFDENRVIAAPGAKRIYSNVGIALAAQVASDRVKAGSPGALVRDRVLAPLGMSATRVAGSVAHSASGPVRDLARLAEELVHPRVLPVAAATAVAFPGLAGVLPGFGRQVPNDWGLGVEIRGSKVRHWMPTNASPRAFGHFGQSGSFLWVDPTVPVAAVALTGTPFGEWAAAAWPVSSARWLAAVGTEEER